MRARFIESETSTDDQVSMGGVRHVAGVVDRFEEQAARFPLRKAVFMGSSSITYGNLNRKANMLAVSLRENGAKPDQVTVVLMEQSIEFIIAVLGIMKSGSAYLPIDPGYPEERIRYILENSGAETMITTSELAVKFRNAVSKLIVSDDFRSTGGEEVNLPAVNAPEDLVYVIYTSGSTGKPKGVMVTHHGLMNYIRWAEKVYVDGEKIDFPLFTSVSFDLTVTSIFTPLVTGNAIHIYSGEDKLSLIERVVKDNKTGIVKLTPTHLAMIAEMDVSNSVIRKFIVGGEDLKSQLAEKIHNKFGGKVRIFNEYGPTETVVGCMIHEYNPEEDKRPSVPIGVPADNVRIYLLDQDLKPVSKDIAGEIYIAGDGVARGYLNNPVLTAERFPEDPFHQGQRMYRTGDLAKIIPGGGMEFLGRVDFQIKLRGYRIEPGEIESVLSQLEGITGSAVILREDVPGNHFLAGYYTTRTNGMPDEAGVRAYLASRLPDYMVPSVLMRLEQFPLTPNHKIDRKALPVPVADKASLLENVPASTPTEIKLLALWNEILGVRVPGINSNFFENGGHSLAAARLIMRIRREFETEVPFRLVFEKPTIGEMSRFLDENRKKEIGEIPKKRNIIPVLPKRKEYPLSSIQNRIWFMENFDINTRAYNIPLDYRITGKLVVRLFRKAIGKVLDRHEAFRTVFGMSDGFPVQKILKKPVKKLVVTSLEKFPEDTRQEMIGKYSRDNAAFKFDLEKGPLYRFELLVLCREEYIFLVNFHHLISDAASVDIFFSEVAAVYQSLVEKNKIELPEIPLSYGDFSAWQCQWLESPECRKQIDYWKTELDHLPVALRLPADHPRPRALTYNGTEFHFSIGTELRSRIFALSRKYGASMPVVLMAAYAALLYRYSSSEEFVIGVPVSTRDPELETTMIGALINTLPLRVTISPGMKFSDLARLISQKWFPALENQDVPFEKLVEELKIERASDASPVFQVLFNYLSQYREEITLPGIIITKAKGERVSAQFELNMIVNDTREGLDCILEFNTDLFKKETISRFAGHWQTLIESVCRSDNQVLEMIPILTEMENKEMLHEWNNTGAGYPKDSCIHQVFENQARLTPETVAVECGDRKLTYSELDSRASGLARAIAGHGAGPGKIVAVFLERGTDLVAALLAVSKTGAAYLPLDPVFPQARLKLIMEDAEPMVVLTQSSLAGTLPSSDAVIILADDPVIVPGNSGFAATETSSWNPAYILYTSGSTGKPKGVMVRQQSVVNLVTAFSHLLDVKPHDTLLAVTTVLFDIAELEFYLPLFNGARLVIASRETAMDPDLLIREMKASGATIFQATPVTYKLLVENSWKGSPDLRLLCGGEAFPKELARNLLPLCKEVWNVYGPTETTIWSVAKKITQEDVMGDGYVAIGKPLDNTRVYVLNNNLVPVPAGIPGELYIGGDGVSPGYHNLPGMTSEKFIRDIFTEDGSATLYRTGDLVKYQPDGNLVFLERADNQVKIRGFRIEPGEIESLLLKHPMIRECVVVARDNGDSEKILVAYYIPREGQNPDTGELRQFLGQHLPDYMVPSAFVTMDQFPLTSNNKIDKKALPGPSTGNPADEGNYMPPSSPTEKKLAEIWSVLLKKDRIGINDNFFDVGGHSMAAVSLMLRIEKEFGVRLSLGELFEQSTIAHHARLIDEKVKSMDGKPVFEIPVLKQDRKPPNGEKGKVLRKLFRHH